MLEALATQQQLGVLPLEQLDVVLEHVVLVHALLKVKQKHAVAEQTAVLSQAIVVHAK